MHSQNDKQIGKELLIAMSNNFFTFFELYEDLIKPIREKGLATEDEIENVIRPRIYFAVFE